MLRRYFKKEILYCLAVITLLALGALLRFYRLDSYPLQINQDELSNIYDAYSISETGADRWGEKHPFTLRGFGNGDYRSALYAYLAAFFIKIFGNSIFAGRFAGALMGTASLLLLFLATRKIGGKLYAFLALLLAVLMPWHIIYSRMAHEGTILICFFLSLTLYLWIRAKENAYPSGRIILLGLATGFGTSTYHSGKLIFFFVAILLIVDIMQQERSFRKGATLALALLVGALPQVIILLTHPENFLVRADNTVVPFSFTYGYINNLADCLFLNLSPHHLFFSFGHYNRHTPARLLNVECIFFYTGIFFMYQQYHRRSLLNPLYLYCILFIIIIPASLTTDNPNCLRASALVTITPLLSAAGITFVYSKIRTEIMRRLFLCSTLFLVILNGAYLIRKYPQYAVSPAAGHQNGLVQIATKVNRIKDNYSRVIIQDMGNQPHIYFAYYCHLPPAHFANGPKQYQENAWEDGWDHFTQLDKYYFLSPENVQQEMNDASTENRLFISPVKAALPPIDSVKVDEVMIYFYDKRSNT